MAEMVHFSLKPLDCRLLVEAMKGEATVLTVAIVMVVAFVAAAIVIMAYVVSGAW